VEEYRRDEERTDGEMKVDGFIVGNERRAHLLEACPDSVGRDGRTSLDGYECLDGFCL
jgi:hypothetical protein